MDPLTHVAAGVALSQFVPTPSRAVAAGAAVILAVLPDVDYFLIYHDRLTYLKHHRAFSHSLVAFALYVLAGAVLGRLLGGPRWFRPMFLLGFLVVGSHLFLDWLTSYGTQFLNPFSRSKFALDWVFIIDPYLTGVLLLAAAAAGWSGTAARGVGATALVLAGFYLLLCSWYHHQALNLAAAIFPARPGVTRQVAALPQPLSPRRWLLVAHTQEEGRLAFVELPRWPRRSKAMAWTETTVQPAHSSAPVVPAATYDSPEALKVMVWKAITPPHLHLSPEARRLLETYLAFSRFPLLFANEEGTDAISLRWLDLRFSVPGRQIPFVLTLTVEPHGRLLACQVGGPRLPVGKGP